MVDECCDVFGLLIVVVVVFFCVGYVEKYGDVLCFVFFVVFVLVVV